MASAYISSSDKWEDDVGKKKSNFCEAPECWPIIQSYRTHLTNLSQAFPALNHSRKEWFLNHMVSSPSLQVCQQRPLLDHGAERGTSFEVPESITLMLASSSLSYDIIF